MSYDEAREQQFCDTQRALAQNWPWPIGTEVTVKRDNGDETITRTRSMPWMVGGIAVIALEGISGGYRLDRLRVEMNL